MLSSRFPENLLPSSRPASVGEVLDAGFRLFRQSLPRCLPFSLFAVLCGQLPSVYLLRSDQPLALDAPKDALWWVLMGIAALGTLWSWVAIMLRQQQETMTVAKAMLTAAQLLPRAFALLILAMLIVGVGSLLLIVPGIYLLVALWPALPILVFEGADVRRALDASLQLVRGEWRHLAVILLVAAISVLALFVIGSLCALLVAQLGGQTGLMRDPVVSGIVSGLLGALFQPLVIAFTLSAYADLHHRRDQRDRQDLR